MRVVDLEVECGDPQTLDKTVQQMGPAAVVEDSWNGKTCKVRAFGNADFLKWAIPRQGYGRILGETLVDENATSAK